MLGSTGHFLGHVGRVAGIAGSLEDRKSRGTHRSVLDDGRRNESHEVGNGDVVVASANERLHEKASVDVVPPH